jgi:arylsulfatase A-like enzyme
LLRSVLPLLGVAGLVEGCHGTDDATHRGAEDPVRRNLVLITVDTLRADHLGCYGYPRDTSPNLDRLAARSTRFHHAVAQWPKTSPSIASLMTSTYCCTNGVVRMCGQRLPDGFAVLAEQFRRAGFATLAIVTNRFLGAEHGFDRGFADFVEVWETGRHDADRATDMALERLDHLTHEQPFFMWLHYLDPHTPYTPPPHVQDHFAAVASVDDPELEYTSGNDDIGVVPRHAQISGPPRLSHYVSRYDEEILALDAEVGRLLDAMEERSLLATTMVVFTADHGESLGDHDYFFEHGRLPYDASLRVPLVIDVPWLEREAEVVETPVALLNVAPTILSAFGLEAGGQAQGVSMWPLLEQGRQTLPTHVFAEAGYSEDYQRIVRSDRWKLIEVPDAGDRSIMTGSRYELYDIGTDPGETHNLASDHPEVVDELARRLADWISSTPRATTPAETPDSVDADTLEALRALGYAEEVAAVVRADRR